jgi:uncharacterized protein YodC (DUF2158 family)
MEEIKVGDVVRIKSSRRPLMTVKYLKDDAATCIWFDGNNLRESDFRIETLQKDTPQDHPNLIGLGN